MTLPSWFCFESTNITGISNVCSILSIIFSVGFMPRSRSLTSFSAQLIASSKEDFFVSFKLYFSGLLCLLLISRNHRNKPIHLLVCCSKSSSSFSASSLDARQENFASPVTEKGSRKSQCHNLRTQI